MAVVLGVERARVDARISAHRAAVVTLSQGAREGRVELPGSRARAVSAHSDLYIHFDWVLAMFSTGLFARAVQGVAFR